MSGHPAFVLFVRVYTCDQDEVVRVQLLSGVCANQDCVLTRSVC